MHPVMEKFLTIIYQLDILLQKNNWIGRMFRSDLDLDDTSDGNEVDIVWKDFNVHKLDRLFASLCHVYPCHNQAKGYHLCIIHSAVIITMKTPL